MLSRTCDGQCGTSKSWTGTPSKVPSSYASPLDVDMLSASNYHMSIGESGLDTYEGNFSANNDVTGYPENEKAIPKTKTEISSPMVDDRLGANWRPFTMRNPYLTFIALVSITLATGEEVLYQCSHRREAAGGALISFGDPRQLSFAYTFFWRFMLPIAVITYGMLVDATVHQVMRMAPFYKLNQSQGLSGTESFLRDPVSYLTYLRKPNKAGALVAMSALMNVLATVIAPIVQSFVFITHWPIETPSLIPSEDEASTLHNSVVVSAVWSRLLSANLVLVACCYAVLHCVLARQRSGLACDPAGVYGTIKVGGAVLKGLEDLDTNIHDDVLDNRLKLNRYITRYGTIHCLEDYANKQSKNRKTISPKRFVMAHWYSTAMLISSLVVSIYCSLVSFTAVNQIEDKAPGVVVFLAIAYRMIWSQFDVFARMTEPYWQLTRGNAPPSTLFIDYTGHPSVVLPFVAMRHRHWHLVLISICSVLSDWHVVSMSSISDISVLYYHNNVAPKPGTATYISIWVAAVSGVLIPIIMGTAYFSMWIRRRRSWLVRSPAKLASIFLYLHSTKLVRNIESNPEWLSRGEQLRLLEQDQKRYAIGVFSMEGKRRIAIDEEPRISKYEPPVGPE